MELTDVYCYAENTPRLDGTDIFDGSYIEYATLHVPAALVELFRSTSPWSGFGTIVALEGTEPQMNEKCAKPTISYANGQLQMASETDGVEFVTEISDEDVKKHYDATIELTTTYTISVYATKAGFDDSDVATATLCYIEAEPSTGSVATDVINIPSRAVLIQNNGGVLSISGLDAGTVVNVYNTSGTMVGSATASDGVTNISTSLSKGDIAIVKIGGKSIKVLMQ